MCYKISMKTIAIYEVKIQIFVLMICEHILDKNIQTYDLTYLSSKSKDIWWLFCVLPFMDISA